MGNLIIALDVEDPENALNITKSAIGLADYAKVGYPLILNSGLSIVSKISKMVPVIVDLKIADIPDVSFNIANKIMSYGAAGFIAHGFVGKDVLERLRVIKGEMYVVAEMSHPGSLDFITPVSEKIALMAREIGADGLVAPATRPERIKRLKDISKLKIISPGVGAQGGSPSEALKWGADYIIVGRSITSSSNPKEAILKLLNEMKH